MREYWRNRERFFSAPSSEKSRPYCFDVDVKNIIDFFRGKRYSVYRKLSIGTLIKALFCHASPSAIRPIVTQEVIVSFQSLSFWPFPHVLKEVIKFQPSITNCNPPSTVIHPFWPVRFCASPNHRYPAIIGSGWFSVPGMAVSSGGNGVMLEASARFGIPNHDRSFSNGNNSPARTLADHSPCRNSTVVNDGHSITENNQPSKSLSDDRIFSRHNDVAALLCLAVGNRRQPDPTAILDYRCSKCNSKIVLSLIGSKSLAMKMAAPI